MHSNTGRVMNTIREQGNKVSIVEPRDGGEVRVIMLLISLESIPVVHFNLQWFPKAWTLPPSPHPSLLQGSRGKGGSPYLGWKKNECHHVGANRPPLLCSWCRWPHTGHTAWMPVQHDS